MPKKTNYKKIFIEDLPKWKDGEFEGCINWRAIRNTPVRFQYNDTHGVFIAKYFDKSKERILVEYDGNDIWCHRSTFKRSNISRIIGKIQSDFRYNIGDKYINKNAHLTIVDRVKNGRKKMYKYRCNRCGLDLCKRQVLSGKKWKLFSSTFWQIKSSTFLYSTRGIIRGIFLLKLQFFVW